MQYNHSIFKPIHTLFNTRTTPYSQGTKSITRSQIKQQVYTKSRSQFSQKKHIQSHYYVPNSRAKATSKFHKVSYKKKWAKSTRKLHIILEWISPWIYTSQANIKYRQLWAKKITQVLENFNTTWHVELTKKAQNIFHTELSRINKNITGK
jgi:hypothetical protein